jgi:hypothetical protein
METNLNRKIPQVNISMVFIINACIFLPSKFFTGQTNIQS